MNLLIQRVDSILNIVKEETNLIIANNELDLSIEKVIIRETVNNDLLATKADKDNVLELDNSDYYEPTENFHPVTKKFIEDKYSQPIDCGTF